MRRLIPILLLTLCGIAGAQSSNAAAIQSLAGAHWFAFGGTGFAGRTSQGELDFRIIMAQDPGVALASFEKLLATGNPQAKGYALAGIRKLNPNRFRELLRNFRDSQQDVQTMEGCIASHERLGKIAIEIAGGHYDLWINRAPAR
jgi:hypothetical protein